MKNRKPKCQALIAFAAPAYDTIKSAAINLKSKFDEKLEAERNDQCAEYPFDDGWKCIIF